MDFNPKESRRGGYWFAEMMVCAGPQVIGDTGDNSYGYLFGRQWLLELRRDDNRLHLYQESAGADGEWTEVTAGLPPVFGETLPEDARRVSIAFDQSARVIVLYESAGIVRVTRWDTETNAYIQNVSFEGVDPALLMDATLNGDITDSDVVIFYLSLDRLMIRGRLQRELYGTAHDLLSLEEPVILDRALSLFLRYELLISDEDGEPLLQMPHSELYPYLGREYASFSAALEEAAMTLQPEGREYASFSAALEEAGMVGSTLEQSEEERAVTFGAGLEQASLTGKTLLRSEEEGPLAFGAQFEQARKDVRTVDHSDDEGTVTFGATLVSASKKAV